MPPAVYHIPPHLSRTIELKSLGLDEMAENEIWNMNEGEERVNREPKSRF